MKIGVDVDDVLYRTSEMIFEKGGSYLTKKKIPFHLKKENYDIGLVFGISNEQVEELWQKTFTLNDPYYLIHESAKILNAIQKQYHAVIEIVTARENTPEKRTELEKMLQIINFKPNAIHLGIENKAPFLAENNFDIMLDDNPIVIGDTFYCTDVTPILVKLETVKHNKLFAESFEGYIMRDWAELPNIIQKITKER